MNTRFAYMYRDGGNFKSGGSVVVAGPPTPEHEARVRACLDEFTEGFIAHAVGLPEVFHWNADVDYDPEREETWPDSFPDGYTIWDDADHCYHEFCGLVATEEALTDARTLEELVQAFEAVESFAALEFDPRDRRTA